MPQLKTEGHWCRERWSATVCVFWRNHQFLSISHQDYSTLVTIAVRHVALLWCVCCDNLKKRAMIINFVFMWWSVWGVFCMCSWDMKHGWWQLLGSHGTQHSARSTKHEAHGTLWEEHCTLHTAHSTLQLEAHCTLQEAHSTEHEARSTQHRAHGRDCNATAAGSEVTAREERGFWSQPAAPASRTKRKIFFRIFRSSEWHKRAYPCP